MFYGCRVQVFLQNNSLESGYYIVPIINCDQRGFRGLSIPDSRKLSFTRGEQGPTLSLCCLWRQGNLLERLRPFLLCSKSCCNSCPSWGALGISNKDLFFVLLQILIILEQTMFIWLVWYNGHCKFLLAHFLLLHSLVPQASQPFGRVTCIAGLRHLPCVPVIPHDVVHSSQLPQPPSGKICSQVGSSLLPLGESCRPLLRPGFFWLLLRLFCPCFNFFRTHFCLWPFPSIRFCVLALFVCLFPARLCFLPFPDLLNLEFRQVLIVSFLI